MNLKNLLRLRDSRRIQDLKEEEQTDKLKKEMYDLTLQFVRKYQPVYYAGYKGDQEDLASEFFEQFLTKKSREAGKEASLLDKFDPNVTTLPYLVKVSVQRMLIDRARSDKKELNYSENYDEETGELSLDFLAKLVDEPEVSVDEIEFSDEMVQEAIDRWQRMSKYDRKIFLEEFELVKNVIAPGFRKLFEKMIESDKVDYTGYRLVLTQYIDKDGKDYVAQLIEPNGNVAEEVPFRAAHEESALRKTKMFFPEVEAEIEVVREQTKSK